MPYIAEALDILGAEILVIQEDIAQRIITRKKSNKSLYTEEFVAEVKAYTGYLDTYISLRDKLKGGEQDGKADAKAKSVRRRVSGGEKSDTSV